MNLWQEQSISQPPILTRRSAQKAWDIPIVDQHYQTLLDASSQAERARLVAVSAKDSGLSAGRHSRHSALNDSLHRALISCKVPNVLEPNGILRDDQKRPDGLTLIPPQQETYLRRSAEQPGYAANKAEELKRHKYRELDGHYLFCPVAFETFGVFGNEASSLIQQIGKRIAEATGETRSLIAGTAILYPLARLFNRIIGQGQYPTLWKQAVVVPIPEKGRSQFRPISLLPPISELFEKIVASHLTNYLNGKGLLPDSQFGLRQQRSTEMQLIHMAHQYTQALLRREEVDAVLLDCSKAFDMIPHSTITASLSNHGVEGELKVLFSDYLRGRSQRVVVDGHFLSERGVPSGTSQGSNLCPILFIIAVNNLAKKLRCFVMQYADDIILWRIIKTPEDCKALQQDLQKLETRSRKSKFLMARRFPR
ncbi:hypothetical protein RvY_03031 [Ramazzottius varieornatus]|uniref:Reverse transcriptase domain-containing protein n=1 Tax=Ramazzottius varieornatus TaxID=947166 RepID=A0A1D1USD7_RAMVA|nr:hypothetical protein RvY_03031 [Ramazzottius varieornatus]